MDYHADKFLEGKILGRHQAGRAQHTGVQNGACWSLKKKELLGIQVAARAAAAREVDSKIGLLKGSPSRTEELLFCSGMKKKCDEVMTG